MQCLPQWLSGKASTSRGADTELNPASPGRDRLVGLVVKASASRAEDPGFESRAGISSGWSHTSDLKIGTPVATLPGARCYTVSAGTGPSGVSIL